MKQTILTILLLSFVIIILSCTQTLSSKVEDKPNAAITYFKDGRTNLCFAQLGSQTSHGYIIRSISNVPCKDVEPLLISNDLSAKNK